MSQLRLGALLNEEIQTNDNHDLVETLADMFDGNCTPGITGCDLVVNGEGECDDTADPPVITATELQCNSLMLAATSPDVDSDGDGWNDLLSGAWRVSAVTVIIVE